MVTKGLYSVTDAHRVLMESPEAKHFVMQCNCGWRRTDERRDITMRIRRHFAYPDAEDWERVKVTPVVAAAPAEGEADGDTE